MFASPLRRCAPIKNISGVLAIGNSNIGHIFSSIGRMNYSEKGKSDKGKCCKDVQQSEGRRVEDWPKPEGYQTCWRTECLREPQPPNYDPYRIKVPEVVVPPLPPSNAKELPGEDMRELFRGPEISFGTNSTRVQDLFYNSPIVHPDYWKGKPEKKLCNVVKDVLPKLGYHGRDKYKYAFHEPWRPLDRMALLEQAEKEEVEKVNEEAISAKNKGHGL